MLKGEISNYYFHQNSGHMYLTIKDNKSQIRAVMFRGENQLLKFKPENGMQILIEGKVDIYEERGQYQLYIHKMQPDGIGALFLAFEQMKEKLQLKGYFELERKRSIPLYPKHIGIVTSRDGAAVKDILTTIKRRNPYVQLTVIPTVVQGLQAAKSIANSIKMANELNIFDVLIVGRGGGSIEDLWGFNEVLVAEAIFHSNIPIISAVGHDTDITISDYVADVRAITPTAAGELVVQKWDAIRDNVQQTKQQFKYNFQSIINKKSEKLTRYKSAYAFHLPQQLINKNKYDIDQHRLLISKNIKNKLSQQKQTFLFMERQLKSFRPERQINTAKSHLTQINELLNKNITQKLEKQQQRLNDYIEKLLLLNPLEIMKRGYAIPYKENKIIRSVEEVVENDQINIKLVNGQLNCRVEEIERVDIID